MRTFHEFERVQPLSYPSPARHGERIHILDANRSPTHVVYRFSSDLTATDVRNYVDFVRSAQAWIASDIDVRRLLHLVQFTEVGIDFAVRRYVRLGADVFEECEAECGSTEHEECGTEDWYLPPIDLHAMRSAFRSLRSRTRNARDQFIARISARTVLHETPKLFCEYGESRIDPVDGPWKYEFEEPCQFIITSPTITHEELREWGVLNGVSSPL